MSKFDKFDKIEKATSKAVMNDNKKSSNNDKKRKLINIPTEWEEKIKAHYPGAVTSYIMLALQERLKKDNLL